MEMQRCPGQRSYCHKIGQGCGGPQHRQAWEEFRTELDHDDLQAMARHFVEDQCRDLTPERRAASAQFVLLLVTTGLELLRGVAVQLHSLEVEQCWAWSARCEPRRPPARPAAQRRPRPQGPQRRAPRRDVLGGVVRQARAQSNPARHDAVGVGAGRLQPGAGRIRLLRPSRRLPGALRARRRTAGAVVQSLSMCSSLLHTPVHVGATHARWPCPTGMHWVCYTCYPQAMGAQVREARERARAAASEAAAAASDARNAAMAVAISDRHQAADIFVAVAADAEARAARADRFRGDDPVCPCCGAHVRSAFSASLAAGRAGASAASTSAS